MEIKGSNSKNKNKMYGEIITNVVWYPFDCFYRMIFSYPTSEKNYETLYCKVYKDRYNCNNNYFYCRMGRYSYSDIHSKYIPGTFNIGNTIGDYIKQHNGLSIDEANSRLQLVGPNIIPMDKPTLLNELYKEFSKSYYVYQNFMMWTWFPYWFYYMGIVNTTVRLVGGCIVATFQYRSNSTLYRFQKLKVKLSK